MKAKKISGFPLLAMLVTLLWTSFGCGSKAVIQPPVNQCGGKLLVGTLVDSLKGTAIVGAKVAFENGSELGLTPIYQFSPSTVSTSGADGSFSLCANTSSATAVLVFEALDSSGNAYPPTIVPILETPNIGTVSLGGCHVTCGFPMQEQSSAPAVISGVVMTSSVSEQGTLLAQTAISALDGSKNVWSIAIGGLLPGQPDTFQSAVGTCAASAGACASYTYTLPSQAPAVLVAGAYQQQQAPPTYSISATPAAAAGCTPTFLSTSFQSSGTSPLTATPGKQLTAAVLSFTGCH